MLSSWTSSITRTENLSTSQLPWTRFLPRWVASTGRLMNTGQEYRSLVTLLHRTNESLMPQYFSFGLEQSVLDNQVAWTDTKQSFDFAKPLIFSRLPCQVCSRWQLKISWRLGESNKFKFFFTLNVNVRFLIWVDTICYYEHSRTIPAYAPIKFYCAVACVTIYISTS